MSRSGRAMGATCRAGTALPVSNCRAGRDSGNRSSMSGNAVRIHRPRVRTGTSAIFFARRCSAAKNHRRRRARSAGASQEATRTAHAHPRFPAQARFSGNHPNRRGSYRSSATRATLIHMPSGSTAPGGAAPYGLLGRRQIRGVRCNVCRRRRRMPAVISDVKRDREQLQSTKKRDPSRRAFHGFAPTQLRRCEKSAPFWSSREFHRKWRA
jgi:hypothetical protein